MKGKSNTSRRSSSKNIDCKFRGGGFFYHIIDLESYDLTWSIVRFGRHKGKTLPQILFIDPDWFFWAMERNKFKNRGAMEKESEDIYRKARNIKIPNDDDGDKVVLYWIHGPTGKFVRFDIVDADEPDHDGSSSSFRLPVIDMSVPRSIARYDKLGNKYLIKSLKFHVFRSKSRRLTKKKCEGFFDDPGNFAD